MQENSHTARYEGFAAAIGVPVDAGWRRAPLTQPRLESARQYAAGCPPMRRQINPAKHTLKALEHCAEAGVLRSEVGSLDIVDLHGGVEALRFW